MKRKVRRVFDVALPLVGMSVIFGSVLFGSPSQLRLQVILLLFGALILEAGVWGITGGVLPNERRFPQLRAETKHFLKLIRMLNAAAVARDEGEDDDDARFQKSLAEMRASVERLAKVAGKAHPWKRWKQTSHRLRQRPVGGPLRDSRWTPEEALRPVPLSRLHLVRRPYPTGDRSRRPCLNSIAGPPPNERTSALKTAR